MSAHWRRVWLAPFVFVSVAGCQAQVDPGPSYAELVVTYNAELQTLDRLEEKREKLIDKYASETAPNASDDSVEKLKSLLESAGELKQSASEDTNPDPNAQLDGLLERGGEAQKIAGQLLDGLLTDDDSAPDPTPEQAAALEERKQAFEEELAQLNAEINNQKERVERARQARDEAEKSHKRD